MITRILALAATAALFAGQAAEAKTDASSARKACKDDYYRFCSKVPRGDGRIAACFAANKDKLSKACRAHVEQAEEARRQQAARG